MVKKKDIKQLLDVACLEATRCSNKYWNETSYNWGMIIDVLDHLRDYLVDNGIRKFKDYLRHFNGVKWWTSKSVYHLTTYLQEKRMGMIMKNLKEACL